MKITVIITGLCFGWGSGIAVSAETNTLAATNAVAVTNSVVADAPAVSASPAAATNTVSTMVSTSTNTTENLGMGISGLGASISSFGGGSVEVQRTVTYTIVNGSTNGTSK